MTFPFTLIDLTHTLDLSIPTWDGGCGFQHDIELDYSDCDDNFPFRVMKIEMHAGIGTHIDAPKHCFANGMGIAQIALSNLCLPCIVIDISTKAHQTYSLSTEDICDFEKQYGPIPDNSCVFIKTGWDQYWRDPEAYRNNMRFPSVSKEAVKLLLSKGMSALGIDTLSPDRPEDGFPAHQEILGSGKIIIENVTNLKHLPATGAFSLALPMKIKDGTEAPARLIGMIPLRNEAPVK